MRVLTNKFGSNACNKPSSMMPSGLSPNSSASGEMDCAMVSVSNSVCCPQNGCDSFGRCIQKTCFVYCLDSRLGDWPALWPNRASRGGLPITAPIQDVPDRTRHGQAQIRPCVGFLIQIGAANFHSWFCLVQWPIATRSSTLKLKTDYSVAHDPM